MERVKVWVKISGDYVAFHEMSCYVVYDVTNDIQKGEYTLEQLENYKTDGRSDVILLDAIKVDNKYYIETSW